MFLYFFKIVFNFELHNVQYRLIYLNLLDEKNCS